MGLRLDFVVKAGWGRRGIENGSSPQIHMKKSSPAMAEDSLFVIHIRSINGTRGQKRQLQFPYGPTHWVSMSIYRSCHVLFLCFEKSLWSAQTPPHFVHQSLCERPSPAGEKKVSFYCPFGQKPRGAHFLFYALRNDNRYGTTMPFPTYLFNLGVIHLVGTDFIDHFCLPYSIHPIW